MLENLKPLFAKNQVPIVLERNINVDLLIPSGRLEHVARL